MNGKNHSGHMMIMVIAHLAPMLLFLILPKFGISNQWTLAFAMIGMVGAHVWMMKGHTHKNNLNHINDSNKGGKS